MSFDLYEFFPGPLFSSSSSLAPPYPLPFHFSALCIRFSSTVIRVSCLQTPYYGPLPCVEALCLFFAVNRQKKMGLGKDMLSSLEQNSSSSVQDTWDLWCCFFSIWQKAQLWEREVMISLETKAETHCQDRTCDVQFTWQWCCLWTTKSP